MKAENIRDLILAALALDLPYPERPPVETGTPAAVLVLLSPSRVSGEYSILVTRRTETVDTHKGQMAFPGGMAEPTDADLAQTAIRETFEEVGIEGKDVEVLGQLPGLWTVSDFWVTPWVGLLGRSFEDVVLKVNPAEIAEVVWVPLSRLQDPQVYRQEFRRFGAVNYPVHVYQIDQHRIWGLTGAILKNFLDRIHSLG